VAKRDVIELRRSIGYVIQQVGLFPHLTVGENVATVPRLLGWEPERQRARAAELLELVGLDPARYASATRRALGRRAPARGRGAAPRGRSPVLLMDEPFGAVDPIVRERLQNELLRLQERLAKTILFVTHDIDEAIKMGDLVAVMQVGGHLAQFARPPRSSRIPPPSSWPASSAPTAAQAAGADPRRGAGAAARHDRPAGDDAGAVRSRAAADTFPYVLLVDDGEPPDRLAGRSADPGVRRGRRGPRRARVTDLRPHTTLKDACRCCSRPACRPGIVVDGAGAVDGLVTVDMILGPRPTGMIDWAWIGDHVGRSWDGSRSTSS
jgi:osmoprotectant transport system ATP-binding protein